MGLSDVLFAVACTPAPKVRKKHHSTMAPLTLTVVATCSDLVLEQLVADCNAMRVAKRAGSPSCPALSHVNRNHPQWLLPSDRDCAML